MSGGARITTAFYPESDGKPLGESDRHIAAIGRHCELLTLYFGGQDVYVTENLLLYYEQGNPKKFVVPDSFVVKGLQQIQRRIFKTWVERRVPNVVIEVTSRKTRKKDTTEKPSLYASLGVSEYFIFDPYQEYLNPPLQGYRLVGSNYQPILADDNGSLTSEELGLRLRLGEGQIQFYRLDTGERLKTQAELHAIEADARIAAEARAANAEAELAQLHAELERLKSTR